MLIRFVGVIQIGAGVAFLFLSLVTRPGGETLTMLHIIASLILLGVGIALVYLGDIYDKIHSQTNSPSPTTTKS